MGLEKNGIAEKRSLLFRVPLSFGAAFPFPPDRSGRPALLHDEALEPSSSLPQNEFVLRS